VCPVCSTFFKTSIYVAVVSSLEALLAEPFIDFREVDSFALDIFCHHPVSNKSYTADPTCCMALDRAFYFFYVKNGPLILTFAFSVSQFIVENSFLLSIL